MYVLQSMESTTLAQVKWSNIMKSSSSWSVRVVYECMLSYDFESKCVCKYMACIKCACVSYISHSVRFHASLLSSDLDVKQKTQ